MTILRQTITGFTLLPSMEDDRRGVLTYELSNGQRVALDRRDVDLHGTPALLRAMGFEVGLKRLPVLQDGVMIGTLPGDFDPRTVRSTSLLYNVRPNDFRREGEQWIACESLGLGDLLATDGFRPA